MYGLDGAETTGLGFGLDTPFELSYAARSLLAILFLLRVMPRRTTGELAAMDLVLILLITEAAAHSLGDYHSLTDGVIEILVMALLALAVDFLSHRYVWFRKLAESPPLKIIENGKLLRRNLRREFITLEELQSHLRANDVQDVGEVLCAHVEGEGHITIVKKDPAGDGKKVDRSTH